MQKGADLRVQYHVDYLSRNTTTNGWNIYLTDGSVWYAKTVIISAGVFGSTRILAKSSGSNGGYLQFSPKLGKLVSGNGDDLYYALNTTVPPYPDTNDYSPLISAGYLAYGKVNPYGGQVLVEDMTPPVDLQGVAPLGGQKTMWEFWEALLEAMVDPFPPFDEVPSYRTVLMMSQDNNDGEIVWDPETGNLLQFVGATESDYITTLKQQQIAHMTEIWGSANWARLTAATSITVHPLSGCAYGPNSDQGVVDQYGRVYSLEGGSKTAVYPNLYVMDGSIIPGAIGVNPFASILTVSEILIKEIINGTRNIKS